MGKIKYFSKLLSKYYHAGEKLNVIILKKSNKKLSICSMIINQSAFESSLLKLSNAFQIVKIEQFFDFLLDVKVEVFFWLYDSLQSSWNFKNWTSQYRTLECPLTALVSNTLCAWIKIYIVDDFNQSVS